MHGFKRSVLSEVDLIDLLCELFNVYMLNISLNWFLFICMTRRILLLRRCVSLYSVVCVFLLLLFFLAFILTKCKKYIPRSYRLSYHVDDLAYLSIGVAADLILGPSRIWFSIWLTIRLNQLIS